jgi:hypothetical protein
MPKFATLSSFRRGHLWLLLTLALTAGIARPPAAAAAPGAGGRTPSVGTILNPDGTLCPGAAGSFDARGYTLDAGTNGQLVLHPTAAGWNALGTGAANGVNDQVFALAISGSNVYVGGNFTRAGGIVANGVARWDGTRWYSLGTGTANGVNGIVLALAVRGNDVYVGGGFIQAGGVATLNVARWNGTAWSNLGGGVIDQVAALAISGTDLFVGSRVGLGNGLEINGVARWDGTNWHSLGTGATNGVNAAVYTMTVSGSDLYVGGNFDQAGGAPANNVARWNGTSWSSLGMGVNFTVTALAVSGSNIYVGGNFNQAGGVAATGVARWDGTAWSSLGTGTSTSLNTGVKALAVNGSDLYVGGSFNQAGGVAVNGVARWDGTTWSSVGTGAANGVSGSYVSTLAVNGSDIYMGGDFGQAGGVPANFVAYYSASTVTAAANAQLATETAVYPNPAHGTFTLLVPEATTGPATATLYNALGQPVRRQPLAPGHAGRQVTFDVRGLPAGEYVLRLTLDSQQLTRRVVVK